jgi:S1-C subfamily serine protease
VFTPRIRTNSFARSVLIGLLVNSSFVCAQPQRQDFGIDQLEQLNHSIEQIAAKVAPAIVRIDVVGYSPPDENDFKDRSDAHLVSKKESLASGIILDSDGYIVTNAHVLKGAKRVRVSLDPGLQGMTERRTSTPSDMPYDARIVGVFPEGDVALLKIEATQLMYYLSPTPIQYNKANWSLRWETLRD